MIAEKHPEELGQLPELLDTTKVASRTTKSIELKSDAHTDVVRLDWEGKAKKWLLTAFEDAKRRSRETIDGAGALPDETTLSSDRTDIIGEDTLFQSARESDAQDRSGRGMALSPQVPIKRVLTSQNCQNPIHVALPERFLYFRGRPPRQTRTSAG